MPSKWNGRYKTFSNIEALAGKYAKRCAEMILPTLNGKMLMPNWKSARGQYRDHTEDCLYPGGHIGGMHSGCPAGPGWIDNK